MFASIWRVWALERAVLARNSNGKGTKKCVYYYFFLQLFERSSHLLHVFLALYVFTGWIACLSSHYEPKILSPTSRMMQGSFKLHSSKSRFVFFFVLGLREELGIMYCYEDKRHSFSSLHGRLARHDRFFTGAFQDRRLLPVFVWKVCVFLVLQAYCMSYEYRYTTSIPFLSVGSG